MFKSFGFKIMDSRSYNYISHFNMIKIIPTKVLLLAKYPKLIIIFQVSEPIVYQNSRTINFKLLLIC